MPDQGRLCGPPSPAVTSVAQTRVRPARSRETMPVFDPTRAIAREGDLPYRVEFTTVHHEAAEALAQARQRACEAMGLRPSHGFREGPAGQLRIHRIGAYGECGYASYANIPMPVYTRPQFGEPDFGADIQVRTRLKPGKELYRRLTEPAFWRYVLVTLEQQGGRGRPIACYIRGWLRGDEMERDDWVQTYGNRDPAWFVPPRDLHLSPVLPEETRNAAKEESGTRHRRL